MLTPSHGPSVEVGGGKAARKRIFLALEVVSVLVVAAGVAAYFWVTRTPTGSPLPPQTGQPVTITAPVPAPKPVPPPDPWHGLKGGPISLEKQGDGRLVYAVGTVHNASDHERFGVKVDVDVLNKEGDKIGSATDYTQVIEPGKDWKFRALVTDRNAARGKLADIKEQD